MSSDAPLRNVSPPCCPLPPGVAPLAVTPEPGDEERLVRLGRWAHALSDPIRLRMLEVMVRADECCRPGGEGETERSATPAGVCVCELQSLQGLAQSKVSYHLKVLRDAGLVREQRRGKWSFYAIDEGVAGEFAAALGRQLGL